MEYEVDTWYRELRVKSSAVEMFLILYRWEKGRWWASPLHC
jgi:hypothetical protein